MYKEWVSCCSSRELWIILVSGFRIPDSGFQLLVVKNYDETLKSNAILIHWTWLRFKKGMYTSEMLRRTNTFDNKRGNNNQSHFKTGSFEASAKFEPSFNSGPITSDFESC